MDLDRIRHNIFKIQRYITKWLTNGNSKNNHLETPNKENSDGFIAVI